MNGRLDVTLQVDMLESLNGTRVAPGYNGAPIGPTLRVKPGDVLAVTLQNNLPAGSSLDRELYNYVMDPVNEANNEANVTIVFNRLAANGNIHLPEYGFWGLSYNNLHFHG
jgi:FtsP/CotA-like multicopper oxidase with cupredoxin domain